MLYILPLSYITIHI